MIAEKILGNLSESTPSVEVDTVAFDSSDQFVDHISSVLQ